MRKPDIRYWVLWVFLLGIIIVVFLQVISGYNIKRLISGNESLMNEVQSRYGLRRLEADLLTIESDTRNAIITGNKDYLKNIENKINSINHGLDTIQSRLQLYVPKENLDTLVLLAHEKINNSKSLIRSYEQNDNAAEFIFLRRGKEIRDSISVAITDLDNMRRSQLKTITDANQNTGRSARIWGIIIAGLAIIAVSSAFWYILNLGRKQERMIRLLNISEKRSKELANTQEQFLANMSHEIRTPMNAILGFTSVLRRTTLNDEQRKYVTNIHTAGENLLALVNDILDLSKIQAGMMVLEETRFSLHSLMSSVGAMFSEKIKEKGLKFDVHIDKDVPDILSGDAVRLTQILVNLLSNGVKFTEQGQIRVNISLIESTDKSARIRISISDTGIGISSVKQESIFERFQQAETETTRRFGGSGLGLSIVKQLVELQKGSIYVRSEAGEGSEFIVELSYKLPDIDQMYSEALAAQDETISVQKIKALIAEDNHMNQMLITHLMKSWEIDHVLVNNGKGVIEELKKNYYSIVLMDIQMPEMDGYTATSIIRNELKLDVPIIAMTAHAMVGEKEKCLQLGMNDYVSKPIKETVLYNIIARNAQYIPEPESTSQKINLDYLHQLSGNDPEFEKQILQQFLVQLPDELNRLYSAIEQKDADRIKQTAHSLKSTVGYIGLSEDLLPCLDRLESHHSASKNEELLSDFAYLNLKCQEAIDSVEALLEKDLL